MGEGKKKEGKGGGFKAISDWPDWGTKPFLREV